MSMTYDEWKRHLNNGAGLSHEQRKAAWLKLAKQRAVERQTTMYVWVPRDGHFEISPHREDNMRRAQHDYEVHPNGIIWTREEADERAFG